jgi:hypothetical protein
MIPQKRVPLEKAYIPLNLAPWVAEWFFDD